MNWPIVMSYNLLHELIYGSLSMESEDWSSWAREERRVPEMRCMVEFNCTSTNPMRPSYAPYNSELEQSRQQQINAWITVLAASVRC